MMSQLTGAVTNIILDAVFILVFKWGVFGAILATVIGQWFGGLFVLLAFVLKKHDVSISLKGFRFEWDYFKNILEVGMAGVHNERHGFFYHHNTQYYFKGLSQRYIRFVRLL